MLRVKASEHVEQLMKRRPELAGCREELISAIALLVETFSSGHRLFLCGNGGSCADAEHIAGELLKSFLLPRSLPESDRRQFKQRFGERGEAAAWPSGIADGVRQRCGSVQYLCPAAICIRQCRRSVARHFHQRQCRKCRQSDDDGPSKVD